MMSSFDMVHPTGMKKKGTLDPSKPIAIVKNADGSTSTVRTVGYNIGGKEVLIPTVHPDGYIMEDKEAIERYRKTGEHFGEFDSPEASSRYAKALHDSHVKFVEQ